MAAAVVDLEAGTEPGGRGRTNHILRDRRKALVVRGSAGRKHADHEVAKLPLNPAKPEAHLTSCA
jgi:hypothetical protein